MNKDAEKYIQTPATGIELGSVAATVAAVLDSYPSALAGSCIQLFPPPIWRDVNAPCEQDEDSDHVALFAITCDAAQDFDYRLISPGYRPGGVSAFSARLATVSPASPQPKCHERSNTHMATSIVATLLQLPFTLLLVPPVGAMLTVGLTKVCPGGAAFDGKCLGFTNMIDTFFEMFNAGLSLTTGLEADLLCFLFREAPDDYFFLKDEMASVDSLGILRERRAGI